MTAEISHLFDSDTLIVSTFINDRCSLAESSSPLDSQVSQPIDLFIYINTILVCIWAKEWKGNLFFSCDLVFNLRMGIIEIQRIIDSVLFLGKASFTGESRAMSRKSRTSGELPRNGLSLRNYRLKFKELPIILEDFVVEFTSWNEGKRTGRCLTCNRLDLESLRILTDYCVQKLPGHWSWVALNTYPDLT